MSMSISAIGIWLTSGKKFSSTSVAYIILAGNTPAEKSVRIPWPGLISFPRIFRTSQLCMSTWMFLAPDILN
jgi:hypothetical protein